MGEETLSLLLCDHLSQSDTLLDMTANLMAHISLRTFTAQTVLIKLSVQTGLRKIRVKSLSYDKNKNLNLNELNTN